MAGVLPKGGITGQHRPKDWRGVVLNAGQMADVMRAADFLTHTFPDEKPGAKYSPLQIIVAIGLAESGGRADAVNHSRRGTAVGIWQIFNRTQKVDTSLFNPLKNAQEAIKRFRAQGWKAWDAYKSGRYKQYLGQAYQGVASTHKDSVFQKAGDKANAVGDFLGTLVQGQTWVRVALVLGGGIVLLLGMVLVYKQAEASNFVRALKK